MARILVDADACPVKDEIYRVAVRHGVAAVVVSNSGMRLPGHPLITQMIVSGAFDAADDWIAAQAGPDALVITGDIFCLSLPLDRPGGQVLNDHRCAPVFKPVLRSGHQVFNFPMAQVDPRFSDVSSDEAVLLYSQYSTQWDGFAHKGSMFDVDGSGVRRRVHYNGWEIVDANNRGTQGELGARAVSIASMAETGVQGRGVLVDLHHHLGNERTQVDLKMLLRIMEADQVTVSEGDFLCIHSGLGQLIMNSPSTGPDPSVRLACAVLDGTDPALLNWITETGLVAIAAPRDGLLPSTGATARLTADAATLDGSTALDTGSQSLGTAMASFGLWAWASATPITARLAGRVK